MHDCSYFAFGSCTCTHTCRSETIHIRIALNKANEAAAWRARNRTLIPVLYGTLGLIAIAVWFISMPRANEFYGTDSKINQEASVQWKR